MKSRWWNFSNKPSINSLEGMITLFNLKIPKKKSILFRLLNCFRSKVVGKEWEL